MKLILPLTFISFLFASCVAKRYYTISADNITKNEKHQLFTENDTLRIEYQFSVHSNQMKVSIFNKLSQPLEVDWSQSALISNDRAISFYNPNVQFSGTIDNATRSSLVRGRSASVNGSLVIDQPFEFIFPNTTLAKLSTPISDVAKLKVDFNSGKAEKVGFSNGPYAVNYKKLKFEKDSTPTTFRTYITFRSGDKDTPRQFKVEQSFYVTEVWETRFEATDFPANVLPRPDQTRF